MNRPEDKGRLPAHLEGTVSQGMVALEPIAQYEIGPGRNFTYLILDWTSKTAAMVDPARNPATHPESGLDRVWNDLDREGFRLERILLTHTHWDHVAGLPETLARYPGCVAGVGRRDAHRLVNPSVDFSRIRHIEEGDLIRIGTIRMTPLATPGHSAGEFCFYLDSVSGGGTPYLFTGDTVFIRDCGRTDFPDGSDEEMFRSLQRIKTFPPETVLLVGHHYAPEVATLLSRELRGSPPFLCASVAELKELP